MGREARRAAIEARWRQQWTADSITLRTPTAFENASTLLTRIDGTASLTKPPNGGSWVRLTIREGAASQMDLNSAPRIREQGRIYLQIFVAKGSGTGVARAFADLADPIYRRRQFGGITCRAGEVQVLGDTEHWHQMNLSWPYFADDIDTG